MMNKAICIIFITILFFCNALIIGSKEENVEPNVIHYMEDLQEPIKKTEKLVEKDIETIKREELDYKLKEINEIKDKKEWFLAYKDIMFEYAEWADPPDSVFYYFTEEEIRLICQVVETECYQQDFESKSNVAGVVFNRFYSGEFGDTITEVVTSANQFAYGRTAITEDTILAVQYSFEVGDATNGALFFHSNEKTDTFCGREYIFTDLAGHHFY